MIGPVSETGRTMMASLQQAISKGMPPDQAVQYVKSMAVDGVAPLADLYAMMKQFQRLKEPQRTMPEGGTLRDQLNMLENIRESNPPMDQGLGGMNAGAMENPSFAGGGIVAFQQGGMPSAVPIDPTDPEYAKKIMQYYGQFGRPKQEFIDEEMQAQEELAKKYGLGQYSELAKAQKARSEEMQRALPGQEAKERQLDRAEFFFNLAAAAADPGATFATSLGKAGSGYTKAQRATNERLRALQKEAQEAGLKMLEAEQQYKEGNYKAANQLYTQGRDQALETGMKIWEETGRRKDQAEMRSVMREQVRVKGVDAVRARIAERMNEIGDPNNPEYKKLQQQYNDLTSGIASAQIRSGNKPDPTDMQRLKDLGAQLKSMAMLPDTYPAKIKVQQDYDMLYGRMKRQGVDVETELASEPQGADAANDPLGIRR